MKKKSFKPKQSGKPSSEGRTGKSNVSKRTGSYSGPAKKKVYTKSAIKSRTGQQPSIKTDEKLMRLNKFIAHSGICSRREADDLISSGLVKVNGKVVTEMGVKVDPVRDKIAYDDNVIKGEKNVYLLLNKPKGFISTVDDPKKRKTVMDLVGNACKERIYPVGRLDRSTTGLLLFTNDGDLTKRLTHPSHGVKKIYAVGLDKNISSAQMKKLRDGITLEDGEAKMDVIEYTGKGKKEVGVEIHMGKNRIIRRMFESIGLEVIRLDRVLFAGLTKKNLPRSTWRMLDTKEVEFLKMV